MSIQQALAEGNTMKDYADIVENLELFLAIYEQTHPMSSPYDTQSTSGDESHIPKRKIRRVRSLIKSSILKLSNSKQSRESISPLSMRRTSAPSLSNHMHTDKRPFPFGQW